MELFALLSPSTGPEQRAIVSLIVPPVQVNRMHHPKEQRAIFRYIDAQALAKMSYEAVGSHWCKMEIF